MGIKQLIELAAALAFLAAATGQLPKAIHRVRIAELKLLKASQASSWGEPLLLPVHK
jgi:hypothetical protein